MLYRYYKAEFASSKQIETLHLVNYQAVYIPINFLWSLSCVGLTSMWNVSLCARNRAICTFFRLQDNKPINVITSILMLIHYWNDTIPNTNKK